MYYLGLDTMTSLYNKYLCDYYPITWLFYPSGCPRSRPVRNQVSVWEEATLCWGGDRGWGDWNKKVSFRIQSTGDLQLKVMCCLTVHQVLVYCITCTYNCGCVVSTHLNVFLFYALQRFLSPKSNSPAATSYEDPRTAFESTKRLAPMSKAPFGQTSSRFKADRHAKFLPGMKTPSLHALVCDDVRVRCRSWSIQW